MLSITKKGAAGNFMRPGNSPEIYMEEKATLIALWNTGESVRALQTSDSQPEN
jgi:hypothetical protein